SRFRSTSTTAAKKSFSDKGKKKRFDKRSPSADGPSKPGGEKFSERKSSSRPFSGKGNRFQKSDPKRNSENEKAPREGGGGKYSKSKSLFKKPWQKDGLADDRQDKRTAPYAKKSTPFRKKGPG